MKKAKKIIMWIVGVPVVLILTGIAYISVVAGYAVYHSKSVVSEFCNGVNVNDGFDSVLAKAKENKIAIQNENEFYVSGFMYHYSVCKIMQENNRVISKEFIPDRDSPEAR